jgi:hypothetical protein
MAVALPGRYPWHMTRRQKGPAMIGQGLRGPSLLVLTMAVATLGALIFAPASSALAASGVNGLTQMRSAGLNYGFNKPDAAALWGGELFVANKGDSTLTVVDAATGAYRATLGGARFSFDAPVALQVLGKDLFVANQSSLTELSVTTRSLARTIGGKALGMAALVALAADGPNYLLVLGTGGSAGAGAVVKVSTVTGKVVARATGAQFGFSKPSALAVASGHVFVANSGSNSVTELVASTLSPLRLISGAAGPGGSSEFSTPTGMAAHGGDVWVSNLASKTVTELSARTAALVQVVPNTDNYLPAPGAMAWGDGYLFVASPPGPSPMITQVVPTDPAKLPWMMCNTNGPYTFSNPQALVVYGRHLWVVNEGGAGGPPGNSLTEMDAVTGKLVQVVR